MNRVVISPVVANTVNNGDVVEDEATVEIQELTYDELRERERLERLVERSFYQAGQALKELRDKRLTFVHMLRLTSTARKDSHTTAHATTN